MEGLAAEAVPAQVAARQAQFAQQAMRWRKVYPMRALIRLGQIYKEGIKIGPHVLHWTNSSYTY